MSIFSNCNEQHLNNMIYEKWIEVIEEKLSLSQFRDIWKTIKHKWNKSKWESLFKSQPYEKDKKAYRIYMPLINESPGINPNKNVVILLGKLGYEIQDYKAGLAKEKNGKRVMKIGKLLNNNPDVLKMFINDPARSSSKKKQLVVISRHPYDIAGMSTDRGWTSCMNLKSGINRHYVPIDIAEGTIIAYLIDENDKNINNPSARILIKPFIETDTKEILFGIQDVVYGTGSLEFLNTVKKWVDTVNASRNLKGIFEINPSVYSDGVEGNSVVILPSNNNKPINPKDAYILAIKTGKRLSYDLERIIAKDYKYAFEYASKILHSKFKEGEESIASDPEYSYKYATEVLKGRFLEGEKAISTNIDYALDYMEKFKIFLPYIPKKEIFRDLDTFLRYRKITRKTLPGNQPEFSKKEIDAFKEYHKGRWQKLIKIDTFGQLVGWAEEFNTNFPEAESRLLKTPLQVIEYLRYQTPSVREQFFKTFPKQKILKFLDDVDFMEFFMIRIGNGKRIIEYEETLSLKGLKNEERVRVYLYLLNQHGNIKLVNEFVETLNLKDVAKTSSEFKNFLINTLNPFKPPKNYKELVDIISKS